MGYNRNISANFKTSLSGCTVDTQSLRYTINTDYCACGSFGTKCLFGNCVGEVGARIILINGDAGFCRTRGNGITNTLQSTSSISVILVVNENRDILVA